MSAEVEKAEAFEVPQQLSRPQLVFVEEQQNRYGEQVPLQQPVASVAVATPSTSTSGLLMVAPTVAAVAHTTMAGVPAITTLPNATQTGSSTTLEGLITPGAASALCSLS